LIIVGGYYICSLIETSCKANKKIQMNDVETIQGQGRGGSINGNDQGQAWSLSIRLFYDCSIIAPGLPATLQGQALSLDYP
jgi:hypothetical protein